MYVQANKIPIARLMNKKKVRTRPTKVLFHLLLGGHTLCTLCTLYMEFTFFWTCDVKFFLVHREYIGLSGI